MADARLQKLEDEVARLKRALVKISAIFLLLFAANVFLFSKTASVRWIAINDRQGHIAGWWDAEGIRIKDAQGRDRLKIGMVGSQPEVQLFDAQGKIKAQVFVYGEDKKPGEGYVMLWDKNGKGVRVPAPDKPLP
ncbi:MAG: hypothetical protein GC185_08690 [Alphaproteobacteria bacterium]|nr:hypothetical protein [Alphaproteobacteria bacterium]